LCFVFQAEGTEALEEKVRALIDDDLCVSIILFVCLDSTPLYIYTKVCGCQIKADLLYFNLSLSAVKPDQMKQDE
jgi:hypothetical protein